MQTKIERDDSESSLADTEQSARQEAPGSAAFDDLWPQALVQRRHREIANTGKRMDGQRVAAGVIQCKPEHPVATANRTGLPDQLKAGIESLSGISMDGVKVHYNSSQPAQLNAHAFAQGTEIHIAPGQEQHLPHEAWHVVQQAQGRVKPTAQAKGGVPLNDQDDLEHESDRMGAKALQMAKPAHSDEPDSVSLPAARVLQAKGGKDKKREHVGVKEDDTQQEEAEKQDGSQDSVQPKMVAVCKLLYGNGAISPQLDQWYTEVIMNGLCGGWAAVHRADPENLSRIWHALVDWDEGSGLAGLRTDPNDVVKMLVRAYDEMNELEPTEDYGAVPTEVGNMAGELPLNPKMKRVKSMRITVGKRGAGKTMLDKILSDPQVKAKSSACTIHIETHSHHMSMRTRQVNNKLRIEDIVESEYIGIETRPERSRAEQILDAGFYIGDSITDYSVDVTIWQS